MNSSDNAHFVGEGLSEEAKDQYRQSHVVPLINNTHMPHTFTENLPGGVCVRCGAEYPNRENCP